MLHWAVMQHDGPVAVRYPRGGDGSYNESAWIDAQNAAKEGLLAVHRTGKDITLITYGTLLDNVCEAAELLAQHGIYATILRLLTVQPLPIDAICREMAKNAPVIVVEETAENGCVGQVILSKLMEKGVFVKSRLMNTGKDFVAHGSVGILRKLCGIDAEGIADAAERMNENG